MKVRAADRGDHWELPLSGSTITQCCFDLAVELHLCGTGWVFRLEQPFTIADAGGHVEHIVPEELINCDLVVNTTLNAAVGRARAFKNGRLELRLAAGGSVEVSASEDFEAWTGTGPDGIKLVSIPGGGLAVWGLLEQA